MIDDADNYVYAEFHPADTTKANMKVIKTYILKKVSLWLFIQIELLISRLQDTEDFTMI